LLYCDNGDKELEMERYGLQLLPGDIMGVHDWYREVDSKKMEPVLSKFEPMRINRVFKSKGLSTRFFKRCI
jgi:hypothetical protein